MKGELVKEALRLTNELNRCWAHYGDDPVLVSLLGELKRVMVKLNEDLSPAAPSAIVEEECKAETAECKLHDLYMTWQRAHEDTPEDNLCKRELIGEFLVDIEQVHNQLHAGDTHVYGESSVVLKEANRYRRALFAVKLMLEEQGKVGMTHREIVGCIIEPALAGQEPVLGGPHVLHDEVVMTVKDANEADEVLRSSVKTGRWPSDRVNSANRPKKRTFEESAKLYHELSELAKTYDICIVTAKAPPPTSEPVPPAHGLVIIDYLDKLEG